MRSDPQSEVEWQAAVDAAAALLSIANCMMYGLLKGGPKIDAQRCDEILQAGRKKGILPSKPTRDLGVEYAAAFNAELRHNGL